MSSVEGSAENGNLFISRTLASTRNDLVFQSNAENATAQTLASFVREDPREIKSPIRRLVEKILVKKKWYNPRGYDQTEYDTEDSSNESQRDEDFDTPSILRAWAFYEHFTLARHKRLATPKAQRIRCVPGSKEKGTSLYSIWSTRVRDMETWGIGVVLYFNMLKAMSIILLLIGIINIPNVLYFGSFEYSGGESGGHTEMSPIAKLASGTALCTEREWVLCPTCDLEQWRRNFDLESTQFMNGLLYIQRNTCQGLTNWNARVNYASLILIIVGFFFTMYHQYMSTLAADEGRISSSDYTIVINNPPTDAYDPEIWRDFFACFDEYPPPLVTVALDNRELIQALVELRVLKQKLHSVKESNFAENKKKQPLRYLFKRPVTEKEAQSQIAKLESKIKTLQNKKYPVDKVYVTMETEKGQRKALSTLNASKFSIWRKIKHADVLTFNGVILDANAAVEPSQVLWRDISVKFSGMVKRRFLTFCLVLALIVGEMLFFRELRKIWGVVGTIIIVRCFVAISPKVAMGIVSMEYHPDEEGKQISILTKITLFRLFTTSLIWLYLTSFTTILQSSDRDFIPYMWIFFAVEAAMPIGKAIDFKTIVKKHLLAPRAKTQRDMNMFFKGTEYNVGERYTEMTKIMFLSFVYSAIWPAGFIAGGSALAVQFWMDKFCLLRTWAIKPDIGDRLALANNSFIGLSIVAFTLFSHWFWWGFPFDNLCKDTEMSVKEINELFAGNLAGADDQIHPVYRYCSQRLKFANFPFVPSLNEVDWMTEPQKEITTIYGYTLFVILFGFAATLISYRIYIILMAIFNGSKKISTQIQNVDFSSIYDSANIAAYIPQIPVPGFDHNCFICDVDEVKSNLIGWEDHNDTYDHYNLIYDVDYPGMKRAGVYDVEGYYKKIDNQSGDVPAETVNTPIFSMVKHWPRFALS